MPVSISKELQDFIAGKVAWVATADQSGRPNLAPKGSLKVLDDQTLVFADLFSLKTRAALTRNPQVAVAVIESGPPPVGYQFKGSAELLEAGPIFERVKEGLQKAAPHLPAPKYAVKITVDSIYSLTPGPDAGKKIA
ncbi:MAG: pyridoxamine 5'-phosphate oxidase family protein [Candidatus Adiutrix sp.]|jgi:predicted pyridoxine 5'-phosphate oxidase superfamily flavin-nucleotide-binding protein|nr:pyridoxamine 5'-phosphate oxidase family protein [Candidatus Adiutrix sp.]